MVATGYEGGTGGAPGAARFPMEDPGRPLLEAVLASVRMLVARPREAFALMQPQEGLERAIIYAIALGWCSAAVTQFYNVAFLPAIVESGSAGGGAAAVQTNTVVALLFVLVAPFVAALFLVVNAAVLHLCLLLVGGANRGFAATMKAVAYSYTANVAVVVPICGMLASGIWAIVLQVIGLARLQEISEGKALLAVLLPVAVGFVLCFAAFFALGLGAGLSGNGYGV